MRALTWVGAGFLALSAEVGGLCLFVGAVGKAALWPRMDRFELLRNLYRVGWHSLPVVIATAAFAGAIAVIQTGVFVSKYQAHDMVGWAFGYSVFREIGPLLIGLMFSGRIGAFTAAELGTMKVTEQIDALRTLALDPVRHLALPRVVAMGSMMMLLVVIGDLCALIGAAGTSAALLDVQLPVFLNSMVEYLRLEDFTQGLWKAGAFGVAIALVSCHFGLAVSGGAQGVGRAVNASVVASAVGIFFLDGLITFGLGG